MNIETKENGNNNSDCFLLVAKNFRKFGYKVLNKPHPNDPAADMYVVGKKKAIKVEIKRARLVASGILEVSPVSENQKKCDAVAVVFPCGYVFIENMEEYLQHCYESGHRSMNWLRLD